MADAKPHPKSAQLARGERRYKRKTASPKQWQAIIAAKGSPCRVCELYPARAPRPIEYHHLVARVHGGGDEADNIVPLCGGHHSSITRRESYTTRTLLEQLSDAEYTYMIGKGGEDYPTRAYGVSYERGGAA